jgi:hypothetical protein
MNRNITTIAFFIFCTILFTGLLLYFNKKESPVEKQVLSEKVDNVYDGCPAGFDLYDSNSIRFCYPFEMELVTEEVSASDSGNFRLSFSSLEEELSITRNDSQLLPIHLCNIDEEISLASISAVRTTLKQESVAGCGRAYRFRTLLENKDQTYAIDLKKHDGTYENNGRMAIVEQSFQFP